MKVQHTVYVRIILFPIEKAAKEYGRELPLYVVLDSGLVLDKLFIDRAKKRGLLFISLSLFLFLFMSVYHLNYVYLHAKKGEIGVYLKTNLQLGNCLLEEFQESLVNISLIMS